jgi:hypothetical protein
LIGAAKSTFPVSVVAGLVLMALGVALLYRWGRDRRRDSTVGRFVLPVAVTITGAILAAVGATLALVPSPNVSAEGQVGDSSATTSVTVTVPPVAPSDPAGSETSATSTQATAAGPPAERHKGKVTLNHWYGFDLDSKAGDWDIENTESTGGTNDLDLVVEGYLVAETGIARLTAAADYLDCANSTGRDTRIEIGEVFEGDIFCVETNQGRWARVNIVSRETDDNSYNTVEMDVVVWEKSGA